MDLGSVLKQRIGKKLTEFRKMHEISQEELAKRIDIHRATLSNIEAGRQQVSTYLLFRIAQEMSLEVSVFFPSLEEIDELIKKDSQSVNAIIEQKNLSDKSKNAILEVAVKTS